MNEIIVTILERLKITLPFRNEKADYILMHDKDTGEISAVPVDKVLAKVNDRVNAIIYPDGFTKTTPVNRVGNTVAIAPFDFAWRIDLNPYSNAAEFEKVLDPTTSPELKRVDTLAATKQGTIIYYKGDEDEFIIRAPDIPTDELRITDLTIFGDEVQEHTEPIITEIFTKEEKDKLALLDPTADIDKPVSTAQAAADDAILEAANSYTDTVAETKLNKTDYNDRFKSVYLSLAALTAAHPTASAGDSAQVNEPGSTKVINYYWDTEDSIWVQGGSGGSGATNTDALPEGTSNLYFTTARVLATALTGISFLTGGAIVSTDSVLVAFGKIQKQINDLNSGKQNNLVAGTNITIDNTNPLAPIISSSGGSGSLAVYHFVLNDTQPAVVDMWNFKAIGATAMTSTGSATLSTVITRQDSTGFFKARKTSKVTKIKIQSNSTRAVTYQFALVKGKKLPNSYYYQNSLVNAVIICEISVTFSGTQMIQIFNDFIIGSGISDVTIGVDEELFLYTKANYTGQNYMPQVNIFIEEV